MYTHVKTYEYTPVLDIWMTIELHVYIYMHYTHIDVYSYNYIYMYIIIYIYIYMYIGTFVKLRARHIRMRNCMSASRTLISISTLYTYKCDT